MNKACQRCDRLDPDHVDKLVVVGGSHIPTDTPWGELYRCPDCGAWFKYTFDHDNEIGYQAAPKTLDRLDRGQALRLAQDAQAVALRQHQHFSKGSSAYDQRAAREYAGELERLKAAMDELG